VRVIDLVHSRAPWWELSGLSDPGGRSPGSAP
jgi:hypothetical protein